MNKIREKKRNFNFRMNCFFLYRICRLKKSTILLILRKNLVRYKNDIKKREIEKAQYITKFLFKNCISRKIETF